MKTLRTDKGITVRLDVREAQELAATIDYALSISSQIAEAPAERLHKIYESLTQAVDLCHAQNGGGKQ